MATDATVITDREFHDEIIALCTNTHWTQGNITSHCWVADFDQPIPEGAHVIESTVNNPDPDAGYGDPHKPPFIKAKKWKKATYCLIGMVLKLANLYAPTQPDPYDAYADEHLLDEAKVAERYADDRYQVKRIIEQLYAQLPVEFVAAAIQDLENSFNQLDHPAQRLGGESLDFYTKTIVLEIWNDSNPTRGERIQRTKEEVIDLVTRARDELPEAA